MRAENAIFADVQIEQLDQKITAVERTIEDIEQNKAEPDFYQDNYREVDRAHSKYMDDLRHLRDLRLQKELASYAELPAVSR